MKVVKGCMLAILVLFAHCLHAQKTMIPLDKGWEFKRADDQKWYPATVPGTVHTDLLAQKLIPEPFFGTNEKSLQWIENLDWEYRTNIEIPAKLLEEDVVNLYFGGLDTYADVYVNGEKVLVSDNMFIAQTVNVKGRLKTGTNIIRVFFHSPIRHDMPKFVRDGFLYPAGNDQAQIPLSIYARKAPYHYGWDWGPRFVTAGIWLPVSIEAYSIAHINDCYVKQNALNTKEAKMQAQLEVDFTKNGQYTVEVSSTNNSFPTQKTTINAQAGKQSIEVPFTINKPKRWWPNGLGEQYLYPVQVKIIHNKQVVDVATKKVGLRTIEVVNKPDSIGVSFYVKVNDVPVFMKGTNYIPQDNFLPRVTNEKYEYLFNTMQQSHFNMVRIWGGGIYEKDIFYELADEKGILVWQDFMFACTLYPSDPAFLQSVQKEAEYNIRRLRQHASLALWCGNNEIGVAIKNWGWKGQYAYTDAQWNQLLKGYDTLFNHLLPHAVKENDNRFYFASSPISNWGKDEDFKIADNHYWGVWHGMEWFEALEQKIPRFMSEYGFQSFPDLHTVLKFATPADFDLNSTVMQSHQRSVARGNAAINTYLLHYYHKPKNFQQFLYVNHVLQAEGMKIGMEAHRRAMPFCMGTLYWQLNDCWPVASWSGMDYYGRWKAMQYFTQKAYAPLLVSNTVKDGQLQTYIVNDALTPKQLTLITEVYSLKGNGILKEEKKITVQPNSSQLVQSIPTSSIATPNDAVISTYLLDANGKGVANNVYYLVPPKELQLTKPNITFNVEEDNTGKYITLRTDVLAKNIYLFLAKDDASHFEDNYFDLLPKNRVRLRVNTTLSVAEIQQQLQISSLIDSY